MVSFGFFGVVTMSCACGSGRGGEGDGFPMNILTFKFQIHIMIIKKNIFRSAVSACFFVLVSGCEPGCVSVGVCIYCSTRSSC